MFLFEIPNQSLLKPFSEMWEWWDVKWGGKSQCKIGRPLICNAAWCNSQTVVANGQSLFLFVDPIEEIALFYVRSVAYYHPRHPTLCNTSRGISHEITVDALLNALCISNISIKPIKMIFSKRLTVEVWMGPWRKGAVMLRLDSWWLAWPQMLQLPWWLLLEVVGVQLTAGSDPDGCQEGYDCCC